MYKKKKVADGGGSSRGGTDALDEGMDFKKIMKDIELFSSSHVTWKERKEMENRKVIALGGKKQRLPLSVARPMMKIQKEREQRMLQERLILGQFIDSWTIWRQAW
ncbi:uncharacterized protein LOC109018034 isoform X2 [Juglans regia]|uniref:Uncharacterized protein LOC109018034 isoform X2 n=1 Tax=Juglans regia TaxID=51240 RepID=A0A2I4HHY0_JUGRE|nr:uncharacterized protein LOC109018034 isoform X2 [Juglans regia]